MKPSEGLVKAAMRFEGFRPLAYWDANGKVWTIGFGETLGVKQGDTTTIPAAVKRLNTRLQYFCTAACGMAGVPLTQGQADAITDFAYNAGLGNLQKSTLLKDLKALDYNDAATEFGKWNKAGGKVLVDLTTRREAEREWFEGVKIAA